MKSTHAQRSIPLITAAPCTVRVKIDSPLFARMQSERRQRGMPEIVVCDGKRHVHVDAAEAAAAVYCMKSAHVQKKF